MASPRYESVRGIIAGWDSLSHLNLVTAVEKEIDVVFEKSEVMDCLSVNAIVSLLEAKMGTAT